MTKNIIFAKNVVFLMIDLPQFVFIWGKAFPKTCPIHQDPSSYSLNCGSLDFQRWCYPDRSSGSRPASKSCVSDYKHGGYIVNIHSPVFPKKNNSKLITYVVRALRLSRIQFCLAVWLWENPGVTRWSISGRLLLGPSEFPMVREKFGASIQFFCDL